MLCYVRQVALFAAAGSNNSFILKILEDGGLDTSSDPLLKIHLLARAGMHMLCEHVSTRSRTFSLG